MTPPEGIYIDMRCQGVASSPAQGVGHLVVYGIEGKQNDVSSDVFEALYVVEKGKMVMQTDLGLNSHHMRGVSVDENGKTSAVSVAYLEDGGIRKAKDKIYHDLFVSFIDFQLPDTYNLVKIGNDYHVSAKVEKVGATDTNENRFQFFEYEGKRGLRLSKALSVSYPSTRPFKTQFIFVGYFSDKMSFRFDQASPSSRYVIITVASPFVQAQDSNNPLDVTERSERLLNLLNKKAIFTVKFIISGVICKLINISDKQSYSFNFTFQNFRFTTVSSSPPNQGSFMFEFFGLIKETMMSFCRTFSHKKFIAIDIWLLTQGVTFSISTTLTQPFHRARLKCLPLCLLPQETLRLRNTEPQLSKKKPALQYCGGQSCHNLSGCRGHHFEPHRVRFFDWVRPRFKSGG